MAWIALALAMLIVGWVGWEIEAHGDHDEHAQRERARHPLQSAVESHFAIWIFMFVLAWAAGSIGDYPWPPVLLVGSLIAVVTWALGRRVGATTRFPAALRWLLAPIHGVSLWFVFLANVFRPRRARTRSTDGPSSEADGESIRQGVVDLDSRTIADVLVPRSQIVALSGDDTVRTGLDQAKKKPHTLYPVFGSSVDQPLGVVRLVDLTRPGIWNLPVREVVTAVPIVPETMTGISLLEQLAEAPVACALVVDEFGSLAGFLTMEDLVEVLVGDLIGEHEIERKRILPLENGVFRVEGVCEIEEFNDQVAEVLPEGEYETVAGLFLDRVGRIPQQGDTVELPGVTLEVLERTDRRILWVSVTVTDTDLLRRREVAAVK